MSSSNIVVQISYTKDGQLNSILLDTVYDTSIMLNSTITEHPVVNGDVIADHIYKNPATLSLRGSFGLNGKMATITSNDGAKLANLQSTFEMLKDEGILCDIVKMSLLESETQSRFKVRKNMVLTSITWTERINSIGFDFSFTQALIAEVEFEDYKSSEDNLPLITEPRVVNFTETLIDWDYVDLAIYDALKSNNLMSQQMIDALEKGTIAGLTGGVALAGAATVGISLLIKIGAAASLTIPGAGQIIGAVALAGFFAVGIYTAAKQMMAEQKYSIKQFKLYDDDRKNQAEIERLAIFMGEVHNKLYTLNDDLQCWQISLNDEQEAILSIDDNYYTFTFTKNNTSGDYYLNVTDIEQYRVGGCDSVKASPISFLNCSSTNRLFRAAVTGASIYLLRIAGTDTSDLTNYIILKTNKDPQKFTEELRNIIIEGLKR